MASGTPSAPNPNPDEAIAIARSSARSARISARTAIVSAAIAALSALPSILTFLHIEAPKAIRFDVMPRNQTIDLKYKDTQDGRKFFLAYKVDVTVKNRNEKPITVGFSARWFNFEVTSEGKNLTRDGLVVDKYKSATIQISSTSDLGYAENIALGAILDKTGSLDNLKKNLSKNEISFIDLRSGGEMEFFRCYNSEEDYKANEFLRAKSARKYVGLGFDLSVDGVDSETTKSCYFGFRGQEYG